MAASATEFSAMRNIVTYGDLELKVANKLVEDFLKWANTTPAGGEDAAFAGMLLQLEKIKFQATKTDMTVHMNTREAASYASKTREIEKNISQTEADIETKRLDLDEAKGIRKNREEYDALSGVIQKTAARQDTLKNIAEVETALEQLGQESADLESQLQTRQRQYALLLHSLRDILESTDDAADNGDGDGDDSAEAEAVAKDDDRQASEEASDKMDTA